MGIRVRQETPINQEDTVVFDTKYSYFYNSSTGYWENFGGSSPTGAYVWTGTDINFFWSVNYRGTNAYDTYLYVTNNNFNDNFRYLPQGSTTWSTLRPVITTAGASDYLETALCIVNFKNRMLAFNTYESIGGSGQNYPNRLRASAADLSPSDGANGWLITNGGSFIDAPTSQAIVTVQKLKDRLIVYFEASTWEIVYTGVKKAPFRWQQINAELGVESTFSIVPFDEVVLGVGNVGIHACDGVNVRRIDQKIISYVFSIHNGNDGVNRVYGIRDYYRQMVYWSVPSAEMNPTYPNKILAYNYQNASWAEFTDSITCFGYYQNNSDDRTWANADEYYDNWADAGFDTWASPRFQSSFPDILFGNQQGMVMVLDAQGVNLKPNLNITNMDSVSQEITIVNHNLNVGEYVRIEDATGVTDLNDVIVQVFHVVDPNTVQVDSLFSGTYTGLGLVRRIPQPHLLTKRFNPGTKGGTRFRIPYIDLYLATTSDGQISVDILTDGNPNFSLWKSAKAGVLLGSVAGTPDDPPGDNDPAKVVYTSPENTIQDQSVQDTIWHRWFAQTQGQQLQVRITLSDAQMRSWAIVSSPIRLEAMLVYAEQTGRLAP
jgi:hypothetical protein